MTHTAIAWTWRRHHKGYLIPMSGDSWNPLVGCLKVSPGCKHCYAERLIATRLSQHKVYKHLSVMKDTGPQFTGEHRMIVERLDEPLRATRPRDIFVNDLGDLFFEGHTFAEIAAVYGIMAAADWHMFDVLTKRSARMVAFFAWLEQKADSVVDHMREEKILEVLYGYAMRAMEDAKLKVPKKLRRGTTWPLPNVRHGVSVENQEQAHKRIPDLVKVPGFRFLSMEPLLGPVDLQFGVINPNPVIDLNERTPAIGLLDWLIFGGESGHDARRCEVVWFIDLQRQADVCGVPTFWKQFGAHVVAADDRAWPTDRHPVPLGHPATGWRVRLDDSHGADTAEWPTWLPWQQLLPGETPAQRAT